jgi:DNA-binding MarR family transcriptional regulator
MKEDSPEARAELLIHLSKEVSRIAGALAQLSIGAEPPIPQNYPFSNQNEFEVPVERVEWLIRARRNRARYLPPELFAEPAWDILVDLLRAEIVHERVSVSSACIAAAVPPTTGLRWLRTLEQHGLVVRKRDLHDARRIFVVLSQETSMALRRYFLEVLGTSEPKK